MRRYIILNPKLVNDEIQIFVSYSRFDQPLVTPIVQVIRAVGGGVFQDVDTIAPGKRWRAVIEDSIERASIVLVFWCAHACASKEVRAEWEQAARAGKDIVPIRLDDTPLDRLLAEFQAIDLRALAAAHIRELATGRHHLLPGEADLVRRRIVDDRHGNHVRMAEAAFAIRCGEHIWDVVGGRFTSEAASR